MTRERPLVLVSNRGPATFERDESGDLVASRGGGGLVTALTGLVEHREAVWVASAMGPADVEASRAHGGGSFDCEVDGTTYRIRLVESDPIAYDQFYNVVANPMLWFIQHYLWDLSNAPDMRRDEVEAYEHGYRVVNADLANAVLEEVEGSDEAVVMLHDYHLYTAPRVIRQARPDLFLHHFIHIPWTQPDAWRVLAARHARGHLRGPARERHRRLPHARLPAQLPALLPRAVRPAGRRGGGRRSSSTAARCGCARIRCRSRRRASCARRSAPEVQRTSSEILRRRRDHLILRVDRADLSKNVLRGFTAFDLFLDQHPEFRERVTFIAQLMPSRQDVPEYAEYLEKIEALVAVVNHRHGTTDWMPIDLRIEENLDQAIAYYKHYDLLIVNAMFDGMNLVAKEGPLVNERHGVSLLSENTGAHEELGEFSLSVNPFDVQEQADAMYRALTMSAEERSWRAEGLKKIVTQRHPGDWVDDQLADIEAKSAGAHPVRRHLRYRSKLNSRATLGHQPRRLRQPRPEWRGGDRGATGTTARGGSLPTQPFRSAPCGARRATALNARRPRRGRARSRRERRGTRLHRLPRQGVERNRLRLRPAPARRSERDALRRRRAPASCATFPHRTRRHALRSGSAARLAPCPLLSWRALMATTRLYDLTCCSTRTRPTTATGRSSAA